MAKNDELRVRIDRAFKEKFRAASKADGRSMSGMIQKLIRDCVEAHAKTKTASIEALAEEALAASIPEPVRKKPKIKRRP